MLECVVSSSRAGDAGEIVLGCHRDGLKNNASTRTTISDQHFLAATNQLAIDALIVLIKAKRLHSTGIAEQLLAGGVAVLEQHRLGLVLISRRCVCNVCRLVVDANHREADGRNLTNLSVDRERTASASHFLADAILEKVDSDRVKAAAYRGIGDRGAGNDCFTVAASLEQRTKCRGSAGCVRTDHLNFKSHLNALISVKHFIVTHIAADQLTLNSVRLKRADVKIANKDRICTACWRWISAVS